MLAYTRFNSIPFNKNQDSTEVLLVISYVCYLAGLTAKNPYILIYDNTGTQNWEQSESDFYQCYTVNIKMRKKPATDSFIMSSWEFPCDPPWLKKDGL